MAVLPKTAGTNRASTSRPHLDLGSEPTVFVDDHPEDLSPDLTVVAVTPYLSDDPHDRGLEEVAQVAGLATSVGAGLLADRS